MRILSPPSLSRGLGALLKCTALEKKKEKQLHCLHRCLPTSFFFNAYLQRLRARREPGQNINFEAGDGSAPPLGALAHGGAGIDRIRRSGARTQADERQQRARYHLHCRMDGLRDQDRLHFARSPLCSAPSWCPKRFARPFSFKKMKNKEAFVWRILLRASVRR